MRRTFATSTVITVLMLALASCGGDNDPIGSGGFGGDGDGTPFDAPDTTCDSRERTIGELGGEGACTYGEYCADDDNCYPVPIGECAEAQNTPYWTRTNPNAPVITFAAAQSLSSTNPTTECAGGEPAALVTIDFYAAGGLTVHEEFIDLQDHVRFKVTTDATDFGVNFARVAPIPNQEYGQIQVGINCGQARGTAAIYIVNENGLSSNTVCVSW
jgi:hypothetical protein